jgi:hypothetical protein
LPLGCNLAGRGKTARPITQVAATAVNPIARKSIYLSAKLRPNRESPFYERIVDPNKVETLAVSDSSKTMTVAARMSLAGWVAVPPILFGSQFAPTRGLTAVIVTAKILAVSSDKVDQGGALSGSMTPISPFVLLLRG